MPDDALIIRNAFNNETFVFPAVMADNAAFDVILGQGGTGGGNALIHIHPLADETFFVRSGRLSVVMSGKIHTVEQGQSITIPRGTPHQFANAGTADTRAQVSFTPAQHHLAFFRNFALLTQNRPEWFSRKGDPKLLLIALVLHTYRDHLYLAGPPTWLQKRLFALLSAIARWRGYAMEVPAPRLDSA